MATKTKNFAIPVTPKSTQEKFFFDLVEKKYFSEFPKTKFFNNEKIFIWVEVYSTLSSINGSIISYVEPLLESLKGVMFLKYEQIEKIKINKHCSELFSGYVVKFRLYERK